MTEKTDEEIDQIVEKLEEIEKEPTKDLTISVRQSLNPLMSLQ